MRREARDFGPYGDVALERIAEQDAPTDPDERAEHFARLADEHEDALYEETDPLRIAANELFVDTFRAKAREARRERRGR